jgi:hypothetical protein
MRCLRTEQRGSGARIQTAVPVNEIVGAAQVAPPASAAAPFSSPAEMAT